MQSTSSLAVSPLTKFWIPPKLFKCCMITQKTIKKKMQVEPLCAIGTNLKKCLFLCYKWKATHTARYLDESTQTPLTLGASYARSFCKRNSSGHRGLFCVAPKTSSYMAVSGGCSEQFWGPNPHSSVITWHWSQSLQLIMPRINSKQNDRITNNRYIPLGKLKFVITYT